MFSPGLTTPQARLPVSCTVFVVEDSMEGPNGIEASVGDSSPTPSDTEQELPFISANLRAAGTDNGQGLVASGPCSFGKIYSCLNEQLRRGGVYKNGAVVLHLDLNHPDILEFVTMNRAEVPLG